MVVMPIRPGGSPLSNLNKLLFSLALFVAVLAVGACGSDTSPTPAAQPAAAPTAVATLVTEPSAAPTMAASTVVPAAAAPTAAATHAATPTQVAGTDTPADASVSELADEAWANLVELTEAHSPRDSATSDELAAAEYLVGRFESMGYSAEVRPFEFEFMRRNAAVLVLTSAEASEIRGSPIALSAQGQASGVLVDVGRAFAEDVPVERVRGKIALVQRGTITFEEKVSRLADAGAIAAVIYNNERGGFNGRLASQATIPAVSISLEDGEILQRLTAGGDVEVAITLEPEMLGSRNVVAELPGTRGDGRVVVVGGHFDTVADTQGANDNGSGTATVLTIARAIHDRSYPFAVRFVLFGAEELGLFGSKAYVDSLTAEEREAVVAMLNLDVPGSGDVAELEGTLDLVREVLDIAEARGIDVRIGVTPAGASSDHATFMEAGIPAVMFLADDLSRIHSPQDRTEFIQPERMGEAAVLAIGLLDLLAGSAES